MATLEGRRGFATPASFPLGTVTTIGRTEASNVPLPFDGVSRRHCQIELRSGAYVLVDPGSTNGTFVNGVRIREKVLANGDLIIIGPYELELVCPPAPAVALEEDKPVEVARLGESVAPFAAHLSRPDAASLRQVVEKVRLILEVNEAIAQITDPSALLPALLEQLFSVLPAERGAVILGRGATEAHPVAVRSKSGGEQLPISRTVVRRLYEKRESLIVTNLPVDRRLDGAQSLVVSGIRSIIAAPLARNQRVLGGILLESPRIGAFAADDLHLLAAIARQAAISLENAELLSRVREESRIRSSIERYLPRELVDELVKNPAEFGMSGEQRDIVVLFSDLRGFTAMSARLGASLVVETMNEYLGHMVDQIFKHGGTLDKFIGDAIMAFWGAPVSRPDDRERAIRCAVDMQSALVELNAARAARAEEALEMGIGLSSGVAVVGNVGSDKRIEYTALGSTVNLAARIEGQAKAGEVLISPELRRRLGDFVRGEWTAPTLLKGVTAPMALFRVRSLVPQDASSLRGAVRAQTSLAVQYHGGREYGTIQAWIKDISISGAGLLLALRPGAAIDPAQPVTITLDLDGSPLELVGQIRHHQRVGTDGGQLYRVGVQWVELPPYVRAVLERWLQAGAEPNAPAP